MTNNNKGLVAKASITVNAPVAKVWVALVNPAMIKQYMFGTNVVTEGLGSFTVQPGQDGLRGEGPVKFGSQMGVAEDRDAMPVTVGQGGGGGNINIGDGHFTIT
jgi:uncharacterized protein YndB with AHSA1/START domain